MKIATWNINSIRTRMPRVIPWLQEHEPDVVLLQETKVVDEDFPHELLEDEGYNIEVFGQQNYNGLAVLSHHDIDDVTRNLPDDADDADRRLMACRTGGFVVINVYVPNGREVGHEHYVYKLDWLKRLRAFLDAHYSPDDKLVLAGDFNITFDDRDVPDPEARRETIHCSTQEREALAHVLEFGLVDGLREFHPEPGLYSWWDYRGNAFEQDYGLRIDHVLLSRPARAACRGVRIDRDARDGHLPSDHAPVLAHFE